MTDLVRPLKIEAPSLGGTQTDYIPTESDPTQDFVTAKGFSFENLTTFLMEKVGGFIDNRIPDWSEKPTYLANGELDYLEIFTGSTQTTGFRRAKITIAYDGSLNPTAETWLIYDTNGTTVLRTLTFTHTFTAYDLTKSVVATT